MFNTMASAEMLDALVPISRFNKGEASKIMDEVQHAGYKIVVKNNVPACVMVSPERYKQMMERVENEQLLSLALQRMSNDSGIYHTREDVMAELGIQQSELDALPEPEYGVDFK
ncbi:MAG: type II toxin-antitoxin system Phd/YefM family antitoxin [Oscillospiraceae bacterium]|jgi:PHD/YefM family antitoxin component YafN of YafNO toxin-antitoxin module|nr:type II toxin-antitoxin system Phd/YefM family antitoxin [Oscillospiraceae bacterium]